MPPLRRSPICSASIGRLRPAVYLPGDSPPPTGTLFANKALAATYLRILNEAESAGGDRVAQIERARKCWSQGFVAEAIDRFCRTQEVMDTSGARHRGVLTGDDMARWTPRIEAPLTYDYGRYTVCKTGPWGQGPVMLQQLALLKGFDLDALDPAGADFIHLQVECAKLAYADRDAFYGDPDFVEVPMATLLSDTYNAARRKLVTDTASLELRPGSIEGYGAVVKLFARAQTAAGGAGEPTVGRLGTESQPSAGSAARAATPCISTSSIRPATWYRRRRPAAGCNPRRSFPSWASASAPARRCSGSKKAIRPRSHPASGREPRSRRRSRCATANRTSPGARPAAMRRTNGSRNSSCATFMPVINLQQAIDAPAWHSDHFPSSFWPRQARPGVLVVEGRVSRGNRRRAEASRPHRRGRPRLVGRPVDRRVARRSAPPRGRQSTRHAGLCGGPMTRTRP